MMVWLVVDSVFLKYGEYMLEKNTKKDKDWVLEKRKVAWVVYVVIMQSLVCKWDWSVDRQLCIILYVI